MRARRIGGTAASQRDRRPAMERFHRDGGAPVVGSWKHQCYCGSITARPYRGQWWCAGCGRIKTPLTDVMGDCGCRLCVALAR